MERWRSEWQSIEGRIVGIQKMTQMIQEASKMDGLESESLCLSTLTPSVKRAIKELCDFDTKYHDILPAGASDALKYNLDRASTAANRLQLGRCAVEASILLMALRAEVSVCLVDPEAAARKHTERALEHLQRSIMVDDCYKKRWKRAFDKGEPVCEGFGAVHLLLHGIWAFKAYSPGERTDLVVQESRAIAKTDKRRDLVTKNVLIIDSRVESADALVLTEWKVAKTQREVSKKLAEGKRQAARYSGSSLAASELASVRYVVVLTERQVKMPPDETESPIVYRFINVAVDPERPSKQARRRS